MPSLSASLPIEDATFVAFDLETTGLHPVSCRIVEFGAVKFRADGTEAECFRQLVNPGCAIPPEVGQIHGITDALVCRMPTVAETVPCFLRFLGDSTTILLAHNAAFDLGFLSFALAGCGLPCPPHAVLDTVRLARLAIRGAWNYRLETLARLLGLADREDHRAVSDARLLVGLLRSVLSSLPQVRTVADLYRLCPPLSFSDCRVQPSTCSHFASLTVAIEEQRAVVLLYEGGAWGCCKRRVTPRAMLQHAGRAYLTAFCHHAQIEKTYRLDRILEVRMEG